MAIFMSTDGVLSSLRDPGKTFLSVARRTTELATSLRLFGARLGHRIVPKHVGGAGFMLSSKLLAISVELTIREGAHIVLHILLIVFLPVQFDRFGRMLSIFQLQLFFCSCHTNVGCPHALLHTCIVQHIQVLRQY